MDDEYALTFVLVGDVDEDLVTRVQLLVQGLGKKGRWPLGRPQFFDQLEDEAGLEPGDARLRTVGGAVPLHRPSETLSTRVDRADLEKTKRVVAELCRFSEVLEVAFELYLGPTYVGAISSGKPDRLVAEGLLREWERVLEERERNER